MNDSGAIRKKRIYVDSPEEAPESVQVQEGPRGGYYYETTTPRNAPSLESFGQHYNQASFEVANKFDTDVATVDRMTAKLIQKFGFQLAKLTLHVLLTIDLSLVAQTVLSSETAAELKDGLAKEMSIGMFAALASETPSPTVEEVDAPYNEIVGDVVDGRTRMSKIETIEAITSIVWPIVKGRIYVDNASDVPDGYEPQEGPRNGIYYETDDAGVNGTPDSDELWVNMDGWEQWIEQHEHLGIERLADYLGPAPDDAVEFVRQNGGFTKVLVDEEKGEQWNEIVEGLSSAEAVTVMYHTVSEADESERYRVDSPGNSDLSAHGPWAALVKRMDDTTFSHVVDWANHANADNRAIKRIKEAIARHGPYKIRLEHRERARSEYPYIPELATTLDATPDPEWWDTDAEWFAESADFETFRDHLINHWTDSPATQGGIIAREAAAALSINPIWDTIVPPYHGFGAVSVPYSKPPSHIVANIDKLRRQTRDYYIDKGVETITLYRGVQSDVTTPAPLESWTDSQEEAERYARDGNVLKREIPIELILFSHQTIPQGRWDALAGYKGGGSLNEYAVLGGSGVSP